MRKSCRIKLSTVAVLLAMSVGADAAPEGLPEGEILYYEEIKQGSGNLVVLDIASGRRRQIGASGSRPDHFSSWSADGKKIVFESYRKGGWHTWICDADGKNARRLTDLPESSTGHYEFDPGFAPDRQTVAFVRADDLWKVTLDDLTPSRITMQENGIKETAPVFSPNGQEIAIAGYDRRSKRWSIYAMGHDGTGLVNLTKGAGSNLSPQWSPDGQHILFYSDRGGSFELYEMTRAGESPQPMFSQEQLQEAGFRKAALVDPWDNDWGATEQYRASYSPDGRWIVFSRDIDGDRELFAARRDGSQFVRLTHRPGLDGQPAWRP